MDVSVVIPAYGRLEHLPSVVEAVLSQSFEGDLEVLVVVSGEERDEAALVFADPRVEVISHPHRLSGAEARNIGIARARGRHLAFTDADAIPGPRWLAALVDASEGRFCVGGAVINGTPESWAGTAEYIAEFLDLHPARPPESAWHGVLCNLFVPEAIAIEELPFPEGWIGGEDTNLTSSLNERGMFRFAPEAHVAHLNRTDLAGVLRHQFKLGKSAANLGRRSNYKFRALVRYTVLAPVAAAGRVVSQYARVLAWLRGGQRLKAVALLPLVALLFVWWGAGLFVEGLRIDLRGSRQDV